MTLTEERTRDVTLSLLAEIAEIDRRSLRGDQKLREDLGLDSIQSLELLSCIGERLRLDLDIEKAMDIQTVDDACAFVAREYAQSANGSVHG
jgi:acyl carrier protein